jgi:hypothetical protein
MPVGRLDVGCLAVLADALEEAGCTDPAILSHRSGPGPHVRGCWAVDLLLGRSDAARAGSLSVPPWAAMKERGGFGVCTDGAAGSAAVVWWERGGGLKADWATALGFGLSFFARLPVSTSPLAARTPL